MDPVAEFVPPEESRHTRTAKRYPLELLARKADNFLNSTFVNLPGLQKMERQHELEMSRSDAESRGIKDGDRVRVFNQRGEIFLSARVDGAVSPGVVGAKLGWAKLSEGGSQHQRSHLGAADRSWAAARPSTRRWSKSSEFPKLPAHEGVRFCVTHETAGAAALSERAPVPYNCAFI